MCDVKQTRPWRPSRSADSAARSMESGRTGERRKDPARVGREMLAYRNRVKRTLGASFRELAHDGHRY